MRWTVLLGLLAATITAPAADAHAAELPELRGWRRVGRTAIHDKKTVWQAIDGAAELFVAYGFRSLRQQEYRSGGLALTVQVYEQSTPLGAFGVFARERPPDGESLGLGAASAFAAGGHCLAYKARYYLKLLALRGSLTRDSCRQLLAGLTRWLGGDDAPPRELALLPAAGQVVGSLGYTRRSCLGTRRLSNCLHADYRREGGKPYTRLVVLPGPEQSVGALWGELAAHWKVRRQGKLELIVTRLPYRGTVALVRRDDVLVGAVGVGDVAATVAVLRRWRPRVKR